MAEHDGSIELTWGGDLRRFRLDIAALLALQESADAGPAEIYNRLRFGTWKLENLQDIYRLALIGGGMDGKAARELVTREIVPGHILQHLDFAIMILGAALAAPEPVGKTEGGTEAPETVSPPPPSTEVAQS